MKTKSIRLAVLLSVILMGCLALPFKAFSQTSNVGEIFKSVNPTKATVGDTVTWTLVTQSAPATVGNLYSSGTTWGGIWTNQVAGTYSWGVSNSALWYGGGACVTEAEYPQYINSGVTVGDAEFYYETLIPPIACQPLEDSVLIFRNVACNRFFLMRLDHFQGSDGCPNPITGMSKLYYGKVTPNGNSCGSTLGYTNADTEHYGASIDCVAKNTWYSMRVRTCGTTILAKAWQAGLTEPSVWQLSTTDTDLSTYTSGQFGFQSNQGQTAFRNLTVSTVQASSVTVYDAISSCISNFSVVGSPSQGSVTVSGNGVTWNVGALSADGEQASLTLSSVITACALGSPVSNVASCTGGGYASVALPVSTIIPTYTTATSTATRTFTSYFTKTPTFTQTPSSTPTPTPTYTHTYQTGVSLTPSPTPTMTPTPIQTPTGTATSAFTSTFGPSIQLTAVISAPTSLYTSGNISVRIDVCNASGSSTASGVTVVDWVNQGGAYLSWCGPYSSYTVTVGGALVTIGGGLSNNATVGWQTVDNLPGGYCVPVTFCLTDYSVGSHSCTTILSNAVASWADGGPVTSSQMAVTYPCSSVTGTFTRTSTPTPTMTATRTLTYSLTSTPTFTTMPSNTPSFTFTPTDTYQSSVTFTSTPTTNSASGLSLVKSQSVSLLDVGDTITYTLDYSILNSKTPGYFYVTDTLPTDITYVGESDVNSGSSFVSFGKNAQSIGWTLFAPVPGTAGSVSWWGVVGCPVSGVIANVAHLDANIGSTDSNQVVAQVLCGSPTPLGNVGTATLTRTVTFTPTSTEGIPVTLTVSPTWTQSGVTFTMTPTSSPTLTPLSTVLPTVGVGCVRVQVDGKTNCNDTLPSNAAQAAIAVKIPVTPGQNYLITIVDGCISYGSNYVNGVPSSLYGTRLRVFQADDSVGTNLTQLGTVGNGSYMQYAQASIGLDQAVSLHDLSTTCEDAKSVGLSAPYNGIVFNVTKPYLYLSADDIYYGYCGDNVGVETVDVCGTTLVASSPTATYTPTPTSTWTSTPFGLPTATSTNTFAVTPGCNLVEVKGKTNCVDTVPSNSAEAAVAVKVPVTVGTNYRLTLMGGCISYGTDTPNGVPSSLYGTRLRIFGASDTVGTGLNLIGHVGDGSYMQYVTSGYCCNISRGVSMGQLFTTVAAAWADTTGKGLDSVVVTATQAYLYLDTDDIYLGYCGDNTGSEWVQVCATTDPPMQGGGTPTFTFTPTLTGTVPVSLTVSPTWTQSGATFTTTVTATPTRTGTFTPTLTEGIPVTLTVSPTLTQSGVTFTTTVTATPTRTGTFTPTSTEGIPVTLTVSPTWTQSGVTFTTTITATPTRTGTFTATSTEGIPVTLTLSPTSTATRTFTSYFTSTPTFTTTAINTPSFTFTSTNTYQTGVSLTLSPTPTPTLTAIRTFTSYFTSTPTSTNTYQTGVSLTLSPTPTPTPQQVYKHMRPYPNPCLGGRVSFKADGGPYDQVVLTIYTTSGRQIYRKAHTCHGESELEISWDTLDGHGSGVCNGVYHAVLETRYKNEVHIYKEKVVVLK